jgi:hypothetical protein
VAKDALAQFVINEAKAIVTSDGGDLELIEVRGSAARVRYKKGHNPRCVECVVTASDLHDFLTEMFKEKAPHITRVDVEVVN